MAGAHAFVGREAELAQLQEMLDTESPSRVAHVSGISGVGKSWLIEKFLADARGASAAVAVVDFRTGVRREPVQMLSEVARQFAAAFDMSVVAEAVSIFDERLKGAYRVQPDLSRLPPIDVRVAKNTFAGNVGDISALKIENVHISVPVDELTRIREERAAAVTEAFRTALRSTDPAAAPIVVLDSFEHIAAPNARAVGLREWLWSELLDPSAERDVLPIKFVIVGQGELGASRLTRRFSEALLPLVLDKFNAAELREYFDRSGQQLSDRALAKIAQITHANPLCLGLVAELINETGWDVENDEKAFAARATTSLVAEFLVQRILEGVPDEIADALRASTAARQFDEQTLRVALDDPASAQQLFRRMLELPFVSIGGEAWQFHELVRDLIQVGFERGDVEGFRAAHARLAAFYGAGFDGEDWTSAPTFPEYVYHAVRADPTAKRTVAAAYSRVALRTRNGDLAVAVADATDGACLPETEDWVTYSSAVAQLLSSSAQTATRSLRELYEAEGTEIQLKLLAASALAVAEQRGGALDEAEGWSHRALDLSEELTSTESADGLEIDALVLGCLNDLGTVLRAQIRLEESLVFYDRARALGRDSVDRSARWEAAYAELYRGVLHTAGLNRHDIATEALAAAEAAFAELHDAIGVVMAIQRQGWLARIRGDLSNALDLYERAHALLPDNADPLLVGEVTHGRANVLRQRGDWGAAAADYDVARDNFLQAGAERHLGLLEKDVGELQVVVGKARQDRELLTQGVRTLEGSLTTKLALGQRREASVVLCLLGEARTELGEFAEARDNLTEALAIARETEVPINQARALAKTATLDARADAPTPFDPQFAEEVREYAQVEGFHHYVGEALIARALHCIRWSDLPRAAESLAAGVREACEYNADRARELVSGMSRGVNVDEAKLITCVALALEQLARTGLESDAASVLRDAHRQITTLRREGESGAD
jgi:tetratricopeptide (TPR) repeat protein